MLPGHQPPASAPDTPLRALCGGGSRSDPSFGRVCGVLGRGVPRRLRRHAAKPLRLHCEAFKSKIQPRSPEPLRSLVRHFQRRRGRRGTPSAAPAKTWNAAVYSVSGGALASLQHRTLPTPSSPYTTDEPPLRRPPPGPTRAPPYAQLCSPDPSRHRVGVGEILERHGDRSPGVSVWPWGSPGATPPRRARAPTSTPLGTGGLESNRMGSRTSQRQRGTRRGTWSPGLGTRSRGADRTPWESSVDLGPVDPRAVPPRATPSSHRSPSPPRVAGRNSADSEDPGEPAASREPPATLRGPPAALREPPAALREPPVVLPRRRRASRAPRPGGFASRWDGRCVQGPGTSSPRAPRPARPAPAGVSRTAQLTTAAHGLAL